MTGPPVIPTSWPRQEGPPRCQTVGTPYEVQCVLEAPHPGEAHQGIVVDGQGVGRLFWTELAEIAEQLGVAVTPGEDPPS